MTETKGKYQVSLCRGKSCCPQLIIKDDRYIITDDIGGSVVLDKSNIDELILSIKIILLAGLKPMP